MSSYYHSPNNSGNQPDEAHWPPWWSIILFLCLCSPVGFFLLFFKLATIAKKYSSVVKWFFRTIGSAIGKLTDLVLDFWEWLPFRNKTTRRSRRTGATARNCGSSDPLTQRLERVNRMSKGKGVLIAGLAMTLFFGFGSYILAIEDSYTLTHWPLIFLKRYYGALSFTGLGIGLIAVGRWMRQRARRFHRYVNLVGNQTQVSLSALAKAYPATLEKVQKTLENMIAQGYFGDNVYLDYSRNLLVLDGSGVQAAPELQPEPETVTAPDSDEELLLQIRRVNDAIRNPELSRKIDRIEEITRRILEFQSSHPDSTSETRKFLNYYLPTTLKILNSYAELERQTVAGENITSTKKSIENMMDMVVEGFERQLDKLFAGDMRDIAADITVMEQMMQGDGLFGEPEGPQVKKNSGTVMGGH